MDPLPRHEFTTLAIAAWQTLPDEARAELEQYGVTLVTYDRSPARLRAKFHCRRVFASFEGPTIAEPVAAANRRIGLFRLDICDESRDRDHVAEWLPKLMAQEYRHFLGLDHDKVPKPPLMYPVYEPGPPALRNPSVFDRFGRGE